MKRNASAPNQTGLRDYAEGRRRDAVKAILKDQLDEFRRGKILTQKGYGIPTAEIFKVAKESREADLGGRLVEKAYDTPLFSHRDFKKDFTDADAKKVHAGLFHKDPSKAEKDAVQNFGVGLELCVKSHPGEFRPEASQALTRIRTQLGDCKDVPLSDLKSALCRMPFGLTESMVVLYLSALVRTGGYEIVLNQATPITLANDKPLPGNRLTTHALALCDWNAKLDKALFGARIVVSVQIGWDHVLPYARVLDDSLKPLARPDDEPNRNDQLLAVLGRLKTGVPQVEKGLAGLASKLGGALPGPLVETSARLIGLATAESFQAFDAAVREGYPTPEEFAKAYEGYARGRRMHERAFELSQAWDYLSGACEINGQVDYQRKSVMGLLAFEILLKDPGIIGRRLEGFDRWKQDYVHAYRKAHRDFHERLKQLETELDALRPKVRGLQKMNLIAELGPPPPSTVGIAGELAALNKRFNPCPDAEEAAIDGGDPVCPKCGWTPAIQLPDADLEKLKKTVAAGMTDRFQRFKDATIATILKKAVDVGDRPDLQQLIEIVQLANADALAGVLSDDLVEFLASCSMMRTLCRRRFRSAPSSKRSGQSRRAMLTRPSRSSASCSQRPLGTPRSSTGKRNAFGSFCGWKARKEGRRMVRTGESITVLITLRRDELPSRGA